MIVTTIILVGGGVGTAATISNHQEQVKIAKSALYQQIDDLSDFQSSEFLPLTYTKAIDAQVEKSGEKHNRLKKYSDIEQIKSETKRVKKESNKARALIAKNKSNQTLLESSIATAEAYVKDKNISSENKEKLSELLKVSQKNIDEKTFEKLEEQNDSLKTASEQVKVQIDQTGADSVRKSQATLEVQKNAQDLLESTFTSETDKELLNSNLASIAAAKTEESANSAVTVLKATITATQKHNKPAEEKAKAEAEKKAAAEAKAVAEKVEADRKVAEKAEADRQAAEAAQAQQAPQSRTVYIAPQSGKKYHYNQNCRGLNRANSVSPMTESDAVANGYGLCGWED
ncbi:hypothetical protein FACS1894192_12860 [Bacilli bacterium]|nr:hypothetical protein FACS1894192_12860 [Bacilli bacterium]